MLSEGRWTHDYPITVNAARQMGFPVTTNMPRLVYELMDLYPQANTRRPSVIYVQGDTADPKPAHPAKNAASSFFAGFSLLQR